MDAIRWTKMSSYSLFRKNCFFCSSLAKIHVYYITWACMLSLDALFSLSQVKVASQKSLRTIPFDVFSSLHFRLRFPYLCICCILCLKLEYLLFGACSAKPKYRTNSTNERSDKVLDWNWRILDKTTEIIVKFIHAVYYVYFFFLGNTITTLFPSFQNNFRNQETDFFLNCLKLLISLEWMRVLFAWIGCRSAEIQINWLITYNIWRITKT